MNGASETATYGVEGGGRRRKNQTNIDKALLN